MSQLNFSLYQPANKPVVYTFAIIKRLLKPEDRNSYIYFNLSFNPQPEISGHSASGGLLQTLHLKLGFIPTPKPYINSTFSIISLQTIGSKSMGLCNVKHLQCFHTIFHSRLERYEYMYLQIQHQPMLVNVHKLGLFIALVLDSSNSQDIVLIGLSGFSRI